MVLSVKEFSRICRACLCESTNMKPLFTNLENSDQSLLSLFNLAANMSATMEDALPKQICSECELVLHRTEYFRKRCKASDTLLKNIIKDSSQDQYFNTISESYKSDVHNKLAIDKSSNLEVQDDRKDAIELSHLNPESSEKLLENSTADIKIETSDSDKELETDFATSEPLETTPIELKEEEKPPETTNLTKSGKNKKNTKNIEFSYITYQFSCKKCKIPFEDLTAWENHLKQHKKKKNEIKIEGRNFQCSLCFRQCKTKKTLTKHMKFHEETDNVKYSCDKCKREFKYKSFLESHVISVHMHNNFTCHVCNDKFDSKEILEAHIDSHKEKKKYPCKICGKAFIMLCTLKDHLRKHTGEKPFLCATCGKGFSQKTNLAQHTRRHLGVKPFKCNICSKGFVSKGELDAHNRKHSGAHPFVCDECGNGFTTSSALVKHRRTHTGERPYPCDLCSMRFAASGTLKNHRRTHTGERPFQCALCDKAFVQRTDLMSHIRCHTGERPYVCTQCGQAFRKASALKNHLKMHGKEMGGMMPDVNVLLNMHDS